MMNNPINSIWDEFNAPLKGFIKKRVANEQEVDDILQEVFIKTYKNLDSLTDDKKIHVWIYSITRNTIIDYYRKNNKRFVNVELPENLELQVEDVQSVNAEIASCLKVMVESLPEIYKEAIQQTEFQNLTQKQLSERLEISLSGAKSRVQRARKMLKNMLLDCCNLEFDQRGNIVDYTQKSDECKSC